MKVALVHDYLNQYGGAERVLESLLDIFPTAHIYTLLYSPERTSARFRANVHRTSILDFPLARRKHRMFIPLMPSAVKSLRIRNEYDLLISDSAGYAKGVAAPAGVYHLTYCYTPLRYAWELDNYFSNPIFKTVFRPAFNYLQRWDFHAAQKPDSFLAVSGFIARKIRKYYGRAAQVLYPPVDPRKFFYDKTLPPSTTNPGYYLAAGRLLHYKRFALVVDAFLKMGASLWVVGTGPEQTKIQKMAGNAQNIRFLNFVSDNDLRALYSGARAFLFPQVEDFGLVAAEAQSCGTPVIAFAKGGALEIVEEGRTGLFFFEQSVAGIIDAVERFEKMRFHRGEIAYSARKFAFENFRQGLLQAFPGEIRAKCPF